MSEEEFEESNARVLGKTIKIKISMNLDKDTRAAIKDKLNAAFTKVTEGKNLTDKEVKQLTKLNGITVSTESDTVGMFKDQKVFQMTAHYVANSGVDFLTGAILHDIGQ